MISFRVGGVFRVRDAFTGLPVVPSKVLCTLDGRPCRPVGKREGYLVLTDLPAGPHRLVLRCRGYREETVDFTAGERAPELDVTLKPGVGYPFRRPPARLTVTLRRDGAPAAGTLFWLATAAGPEIKLAQSDAETGAESLRLFCKVPDAVSVPAPLLLEDGADSELVVLRDLQGETGWLERPLLRPHGRGRRLLPAQRYRADDAGAVTALLRDPCEVLAFQEDRGLLGRAELDQGGNTLELTLK